MAIDRDTALSRIKGLLKNEVTKEEVYHWALSKVMSKDYEELLVKDPLLHEAVEAMLNINHADSNFAPSQEDLEYYRDCLEGSLPFHSRKTRVVENKIVLPKVGAMHDMDLICRIYVILFAVCVIAVHVVGIFIPSFLNISPLPSKLEAFSDSLPHIIYAVILLVHPKALVRDNFFYAFFVVLCFGVYYYIYVSMSLVAKFSLHFLVLLIILPYGGLPAALALVLLIKERMKLNLSAEKTKAQEQP